MASTTASSDLSETVADAVTAFRMPRRLSVRTALVGCVSASVFVAWAGPLVLSGAVDPWWLSQVVRPGLWLLVLAVSVSALRLDPGARIAGDSRVISAAAIVGLVHVVILVAAGFVVGFGRSPYARGGVSMALNIASVVSVVTAIELARSYLLGTRRGSGIGLLVGLGVLFAAIELDLASLTVASGVVAIVTVIGSRVLPTMGEQLLAGTLTLAGGVGASITYRLIVNGFHWLSPILPDIQPIASGFLTVLLSVVFMVVVAGIGNERLGDDPQADGSPQAVRSSFSWVAVSIACVVMVWFASGALGVRPLVVVSGSMRPGIDVGDIVIVQPVRAEKLSAGDVIAFETRSGTTIHRIVRGASGSDVGRYFVTKGDNNKTKDAEPVVAENVMGRVRTVVPWVGWISIKVKSFVSGAVVAEAMSQATTEADRDSR